jgi:hypothetical protein
MNARQERGVARLDQAVLQLRFRVRPANAPPMFERYVIKLQTSVGRLHELAREQYTLTPQQAEEGEKTSNLRKHLRRKYMIPLTRTGRRVLRFAPGIEQALKAPHARASHREIVTTAEVMLKAVRPHQALFVNEGFPKTFFTEFRDVTRMLKRIATTASQRQTNFARVSRELREEFASANETLRILDGLVLAYADHDRQFAKNWKDVMRTPKPLGRPSAKKRKLSPNVSGHGSREEPLTT